MKACRGFTLIELIIVMAILGILLTVAIPRYFGSLERSREAALKQDLGVMREAIDKYYGDQGRYPETLSELVARHYLRKVPPDPLTGSSETWIIVAPPVVAAAAAAASGVYDVKSGAPGQAQDGSDFSGW